MAVAAQRIVHRVKEVEGYKIAKRKVKNPARAVSGFFIFLTAAVLIYVALFAGMVQAQYKISSLRTRINTLSQDNKELKFTLLRLKAKDRIEKIARTQLGMKEPEDIAFVEVH